MVAWFIASHIIKKIPGFGFYSNRFDTVIVFLIQNYHFSSCEAEE